MADSTNQLPPRSQKKTKLFIAVLTSILLVALTAAVAVSLRHTPATVHGSHAVIKSSCSSTLYPELCYSAAAQATAVKMDTTKDVVHVLLNYTITTVQHNYAAIAKKIDSSGLTAREITALHDCLAMVDQSLDELHLTLKDLDSTDKSISELGEDLKTLLSGAMTNQESCLDGFSHDTSDKKVRESLLEGQTHVFRLCSNALAIINNITESDDVTKQTTLSRKLLGKDESGVEWPEWLSTGDRRLLQSTTVTPDVTVAADGSGNYRTVSAAVAAAPEGSSKRYVIRIKAGVYRENVEVPSRKTNLMFVGDGQTTTIITASRNVVDGSTTFNSATVAIVGAHFLARGITFQNAAGPSKHQAVALRVNADYSAFYQCGFIAYQDTLYVHSLRQYFVNCYIAGTIDFIFGNSAAVLQNCDIHARRPNPSQKNMVTAQGRDDPNQNTGIVIQKCRIGATSDLKPVQSSFPTYLGRPWKTYSRTVVMQTSISDVIHPDGWFPWDGNFALDTLYYAEHANTGAGASTANRVTWKGFRVIGSTEAQAFTAGQFIAGGSWLGLTGFPFFLGL